MTSMHPFSRIPRYQQKSQRGELEMKVYLFLPSSVACDQSHGLARETLLSTGLVTCCLCARAGTRGVSYPGLKIGQEQIYLYIHRKQ